MQVGQRYGLPLLSPVDDAGHFTDEAGPKFAGLMVQVGPACALPLSSPVPLQGSAPLNTRCASLQAVPGPFAPYLRPAPAHNTRCQTDGNKAVIAELHGQGALLLEESYEHK